MPDSPKPAPAEPRSYLPFEKPIADLERKIEELRALTDVSLNGELTPLEGKRDRLLVDIYSRLTPWEKVLVARASTRPQFRDYVTGMCDDWLELHGDRLFGEDPAISTGFARIGPHRVLLVGHRKGRDTKEKLACNFGCAHPEGYRKALQKMRLAARYGLPIVTLINTPGAYPGVGAEERGQAWAIAENILEMSMLPVPVVCVVIGEGGSGGALGIGVGDRVLMLEHSYYSVISPEGCAAILWKDGGRAAEAAQALRLTSDDLLRLGVVDEVVAEPLGGAHRDARATVQAVKDRVLFHLEELLALPPEVRTERRYARLRALGNDVAPLDPSPEPVSPVAREG
jgi:acetyl-CoA carboxylase carboxyl transferase subunit alpha